MWLMITYFEKKYHYRTVPISAVPPENKNLETHAGDRRPAGTEFFAALRYIVLVYAIIRGFGPEAQAGFGIGRA